MSYYVLLGLGGHNHWIQHIEGTARAINKVNPDFVRIRRLWLYRAGEQGVGPECPLWKEVRLGKFVPQTAEGTLLELRTLLEKLDGISSFVTCDHANNYVRVEGQMPHDRASMIEKVTEFLSLPLYVRERHYEEVGSQI